LGVDLGDILPRKKTSLEELSGRVVAVDTYNALYQFLAIIRGRTGEPLMDSQGRVTSHLSGLLYRTSNLVERGIKPVYVFDGEPPELKEVEIKRRRKVKEEALVKYEAALSEGRVEEAKRYAQMTSQLKDGMVEDGKRLLTLMGIPVVQAPSEGECQAAYMATRGDVWAVASQDHDSLLFGAPRLLRNMTITGRRKLPRRDTYVEVGPEVIELDQVLGELKISREQLVDLGILVGTDFNPDGVKGVGPKTALKMLREHGTLEKVIPHLKEAEFLVEPSSIREIFLKPKVTSEYKIEWGKPDVNGVVQFLCEERDFSEERVRNALEKMTSPIEGDKGKRTLESFFEPRVLQ